MASITKSGGRRTRRSLRAKQAELGDFFSDVEDLLARLTHLPDESIARVRERVASSIESARSSVEEGVEKIVDTTNGAAKATDEYVHENPWRVIGVAAVACLLVGALLRRP